MQLVAYGAQDIYLTGNPQITFFKVVYRRHTNFSMESIEQTMNGTTSPTAEGQTATCTISRNGDLIHRVYVTTDVYPTSADADWEGSKLIKEVELEIGGQRIDRHYTEWNQVWEELCTPESKAVALKAMKGDIGTRGATAAATTGTNHVQIPLNFWFCRNVGLALPLIALQYHEVKLKFIWNLPGSAATGGYSSNVIVDYIYLDTDERRRFAQVSHEYLIEQIQKFDLTKGTTETAPKANLNFNHPVKELIWTNDAGAEEATAKVQLKLNGHDRFSERPLEYFQLRQPYEYHSAVPRQNLPLAGQQTFFNDNLGTIVSPTTAAGTNLSTEIFAGNAGGGTLAEKCFTYDPATAGGTITLHTTTISTINAGQLVVGDQLLVSLSSSSSPPTIANQGMYLGKVSGGTAVATASVAGGDITDGSKTITFESGLVRVGDVAATPMEAVADAEAATSLLQILGKYTRNVSQARTSKMLRKINVYSFGLKPEEHQPSGTCNFSRIDSAKLEFSAMSASIGSAITIYAVNYNVLRIMSGMGGLAYSN